VLYCEIGNVFSHRPGGGKLSALRRSSAACATAPERRSASITTAALRLWPMPPPLELSRRVRQAIITGVGQGSFEVGRLSPGVDGGAMGTLRARGGCEASG
jgi:hypothetical protein